MSDVSLRCDRREKKSVYGKGGKAHNGNGLGRMYNTKAKGLLMGSLIPVYAMDCYFYLAQKKQIEFATNVLSSSGISM